MAEYIPEAPVNDAARKRNGSLPGMGGVYNTINAHLYHYAGNNPVRYIDPDGNDFNSFMFNISFGMMNGEMPTSDTFNNAFPSSNPGIASKNYEKADQSGNLPTVKDAQQNGFKPLSPRAAAWHRQGEGNEYNIKMVHEDGREAVYNKDGNLVFDKKNLGTKNDYNDVPGHIASDVGPYLFSGNTREDKPKGLIGFFYRIGVGIQKQFDIPKDYYQHWDSVYHPESYE
jgi:hypothetical protein